MTKGRFCYFNFPSSNTELKTFKGDMCAAASLAKMTGWFWNLSKQEYLPQQSHVLFT